MTNIKQIATLSMPGLYTYVTRARTLYYFFLTYVMYPAGIVIMFLEAYFVMNNNTIGGYIPPVIDRISYYLLGYLILFAFYEGGYIFNDYVSTKKETFGEDRSIRAIPRTIIIVGTIMRVLICCTSLLIVYIYVDNNATNNVYSLCAVLILGYMAHLR